MVRATSDYCLKHTQYGVRVKGQSKSPKSLVIYSDPKYFFSYIRSMIIAGAMPPAAHMVTRPTV